MAEAALSEDLGRLSLRSGSFHSKRALRRLYEKAENYVMERGSRMRRCERLYRDKSIEYFEDIRRNHGQIMETYTKDYHGDPKSPSNGRLDGLFFTANVMKKTHKPPDYSIYGERRFLIDPERILSKCPNMYFTDFYCVHKQKHYVTLILTKHRSAADRFCQKRLIEVDIEDNPFFKQSEDGSEFHVTDGVWVEILVTEDINIRRELRKGAEMEDVTMTGLRTGGRTGLPKDDTCPTCNL